MKLFMYSLERVLYEGDASKVTLPSTNGEITVLNHHIPLVTPLKQGTIRIHEGKEQKNFSIKSGFCQVNKDKIILLVS